MLVMAKNVAVGHCLLALCDAVFCPILFEKQSLIEAKSFDGCKSFDWKILTAAARACRRSAKWQRIELDLNVIEDFSIENAVKTREIDEN